MCNEYTAPTERAEMILNQIKKTTGKLAFSLKLNLERKPAITDTKFSGYAYWDKNLSYPTNDLGDKMFLIAQINLDKLDVSGTNLPTKGMLQFFVSNDELFGLEMKKGFKVVYHENIDYSITEDDVKALGVPNSICNPDDKYDYFPIVKEYAVDIERKTSYPGAMNYNFIEMVEEISGVSYDDLDDDEEEFLDETFENEEHLLLGYPFFTQGDPREDDEYRDYDTLLFQMSSDFSDDQAIMWGDCGVANFFIKDEDLKNKNFDDILYNWDCC